MNEIALGLASHIGLLYGVVLGVGLTLATVIYLFLRRQRQRAPAPVALAHWWRLGVPLLLGIVALLAWRTRSGQVLPAFDAALAQAMTSELSPAALQGFALLTRLGDTATLTVLCIIVAGVLLVLRQRLLALWWVLALAGNGLLNLGLKALFARVRPEFVHELTHAAGWSFPSGHSSGALVGYGMLAVVVCQGLSPRARLPVLLGAVALVLTIGLSRIALHVHYLSDVLAGFCSGALWLTLCVSGYYWQRDRAVDKPTGDSAVP